MIVYRIPLKHTMQFELCKQCGQAFDSEDMNDGYCYNCKGD